jgi:hypothetical protein
VGYLPAGDGTALVAVGDHWFLTDAQHQVVGRFPDGWEPEEFEESNPPRLLKVARIAAGISLCFLCLVCLAVIGFGLYAAWESLFGTNEFGID